MKKLAAVFLVILALSAVSTSVSMSAEKAPPDPLVSKLAEVAPPNPSGVILKD